ncbi:SCP2 sterol-binding domain-containing protein [Endozoicomonas sp. G2_1]|uniref:SCP2 sterol-binding domain-containing protein n=1 Tax=Endozoicomonas sp. G2_1 TaxID=2821091 RepID=UPI001ADCCB2E|nr:SCP2 sterol-binding domain-containing protein [Endozoicomonas sp. G2_1]MBO9489869.1 SCP2 sterol-binding domain-containing protein [Endozoicomonas sp. G2_1]
MNTQQLVDVLIPAVDKFGGFPSSVKFVIGEESTIFVHNKEVIAEDRPASCTITMSLETMQQIIAGEVDAMGAVMEGDVSVEGDTSVAVSVQGLF